MKRIALDTTFLIDLQNERRKRGVARGALDFLRDHAETVFYLPVIARGEYLEGFADPESAAERVRPLWRDLILKVWGADPLQCPCCKAPMKLVGAVKRPEQIEFFLRLHGL